MILVIDVGGTTTRLGISRIGVKLDRHTELRTPQSRDGMKQIAASAAKLLSDKKAQAIVLGLPATFMTTGRMYHLNNLPEWDGIDPQKVFEELTDGPVLTLNDAVMAGLGEAYVGSGATKGVMAYVTVSTGVNGARFVHGHHDPNGHYQLGDQLISWDPPVRLEEVIGGHSIQQRYGRLPSTIDDPALWQREVKALAAALHNLSMHWSPELIVLGGSMMRDIPLSLVERELKQLANPFPKRPELRPAALGQLGGLHGGLAYWRQHEGLKA
jgi:predicted NBD/HSP70 family sugar kinase